MIVGRVGTISSKDNFSLKNVNQAAAEPRPMGGVLLFLKIKE